ncbi:MAG: hypothetical protein AABW88_04775 [Nanoarchaeota archaeon]
MSEVIKGNSTRIKFEGVFDWDELYSTITGWVFSKKFDYYERNNVRKRETYGYKRELKAEIEREESGYVKHMLKIEIISYHMEDIEVVENGEKKKRTRTGMMTIEISPSIELDWQDKWNKKFKKKARDFMHKYIMQGYVQEQLDKIYYEMYKLQTKIKEELKMEAKYSAY